MKKRFLLLSIVIILVAVFGMNQAAAEISYAFNFSGGTLTISGEGPMPDFTGPGMSSEGNPPPWFNLYIFIKKVVIEKGITYIGEESFYDWWGRYKIAEIEIPDTVVSIGNSAFSNLDQIQAIVIPASVKSIGRDAFNDCRGAKKVDLPEGLESIGESAFRDCDALEEINIPASVKKIEFTQISSSTPTFSGKKLKAINVAEGNATYFSVDGVLFSREGDEITLLEYPMAKADTKYIVPQGVTVIHEYAFFDNPFLEEVVFPDGLKKIGTFDDCPNLKKVTVPSSVQNLLITSNQPGYISWTTYKSLVLNPYGMKVTIRCEEGSHVEEWAKVSEYPTELICYGWKQLDGSWYYYDSTGEAATGWNTIDGATYYFNEEGRLQTGWISDGGKWYFAEDSGALATGWKSVGGDWYYFKADGEMATGWLKDGGDWYYMKDSGRMATGWVEDGNDWYYFRDNGVMLTGWVQSGGNWYYMKSGGAMATGWLKDGGAWYYFNGSGKMVTGWQRIGGKWYCFRSSGAMITGWFEDKEAEKQLPAGAKQEMWYWFDESGVMATGWKEIKGQWEMFAENGLWLYTWQGN